MSLMRPQLTSSQLTAILCCCARCEGLRDFDASQGQTSSSGPEHFQKGVHYKLCTALSFKVLPLVDTADIITIAYT